MWAGTQPSCGPAPAPAKSFTAASARGPAEPCCNQRVDEECHRAKGAACLHRNYSTLERSWMKCRENNGSKGEDCIEHYACAWCCARRPEAPASAAQPALSAPPQLHMHGRWGAKERPQINVLPACCHCTSSNGTPTDLRRAAGKHAHQAGQSLWQVSRFWGGMRPITRQSPVLRTPSSLPC